MDDHAEELDEIFGDAAPEGEETVPASDAAEPIETKTDGDDHSAVASTTEDKPSNSEPDKAAAPELDEETLALAHAWGISREAATQLGEVGVLRETNRLWLRDAVSREQSKAAPTKEQEDEIAKAMKEIEEDPEGYDPKIKAVIKGMYEELQRTKAEISESKLRAAHQEQLTRQEFDRRETETWDNLFNAIDMPDKFGKGKYGDLRQDSPEMASRVRVMQQVNAQYELASRRGETLTERELLNRAIDIEYPDAKRTKEQSELGKKLSSREKQFSVRPRASRASAPKSEKEAFHEVFSKVIGSKSDEQTVEEMIGQ